MLDLGWPEIFVIVLVALVVLGPKELPGAIRTVTGLVARARKLAREFHKSIDEMAKESGLDEIKRDIQKVAKAELEDDGAFGNPFAEADKNSILNPTNGSKLPKPTQSKPAQSETPEAQSKPAQSKPNGDAAKSEAAKSEATAKPAAKAKPDKPTAGAKPSKPAAKAKPAKTAAKAKPAKTTAKAKPAKPAEAEPAPEAAKENTRA